MGLIYRENRKLFDNHASITFTPVFKLVAIMLVSLPICMALLKFVSPLSIAIMGVVAVVGVLLLMVESYFVFGLKDVWTEFGQKMRANTPIA